MPEMRLQPGLRPDPAWGAYSAPLDTLAGYKGRTSKGKGEEAREGGMGGKGRKGKGRGGEGKGGKRGGEGSEEGLTPTFLYPPLPLHTITNRKNFYFKVSNRLSTRIHQLDFINVLVR